MKCTLCNREAQAQSKSQYCQLHERAYENIAEKFPTWKKATGTDWQHYLKEITINPNTGVLARQVAESLLSLERNV